MTDSTKRQALVLLGHASTLHKRTRQKRRGRPEGAEVSKQLILRAFQHKSETLTSALRQKWGFPVSSELWANPDFLKDEMALTKPRLTIVEIIEMTGLSRGTVVKLVPELVKDGSLHFTMIRNTKIYEPRSLEECRKPLTIEGTRFRKQHQVKRLQKLGLDVYWEPRSRGRPIRIPLISDHKTLNQDEDVKLAAELMNLVKKGYASFVESIAGSTGMKFELRDGYVFFSYTTKPEQAYRNGQADRLRKRIDEARKDQKQRRREEKTGLGSLPLDATEKDWIMRNARSQ